MSPTSGASVAAGGAVRGGPAGVGVANVDNRRVISILRNDGPNGLLQFAALYDGEVQALVEGLDVTLTNNDTRFLPATQQLKVISLKLRRTWQDITLI